MSERGDAALNQVLSAVEPVIFERLMFLGRADALALVRAVMKESAQRIANAIKEEGRAGSECSAVYELCEDIAACWPERSPLTLTEE